MTGRLTHPGQLGAVASDRNLIPQAIDEALRWEGPVTSTFRYAAQDTEIEGMPIRKGTYINTVLASANRDPRKFANPAELDIFSSRTTRHTAFASAPHPCIRPHTARREMQRARHAIPAP